jgi:hypothetical protein
MLLGFQDFHDSRQQDQNAIADVYFNSPFFFVSPNRSHSKNPVTPVYSDLISPASGLKDEKCRIGVDILNASSRPAIRNVPPVTTESSSLGSAKLLKWISYHE